MLKRLYALLLVALLGLGAGQAQAQATPKIGYTDHEVIIVNMPEYRQIRQKLQTEYQGSQGQLQTKFQDYQEKLEKYQKQQALLSDERRAEREKELMALQEEIQKAAANEEQALAEREVELMKPLLDKVQNAIDTVAKRKGLDLVLRTQAGPMQPIILYVNDQTIADITPDVARQLGLEVDESAASN